MRWLCLVCIGVVAVQWTSSYPLTDSHQETLLSVEESLGKPTAEHHTIRDKRTIGVLRRIFPELSKASRRKRDADTVEGESGVNQVRVPVPDDVKNDLQIEASDDNDEAESSQEEITDDESDGSENTRNKRLGVFGNLFSSSSGGGGGGSGGNSGSGSGGGSGNFLFDIIRTAADGAARAAGSVYRLVAGIDPGVELLAYNNDQQVVSTAMVPQTVAAVQTPAPPPTAAPRALPARPTLVAGSGATEQQDENANAPIAPASGDQASSAAPATDDGYQAGIPGPITRLFVIANRGIANLIQDLILRLAQTSERIVNFKARLITAII